MRPTRPNGEKILYAVLRTFDENGGYIQFASIPNGTVIEGKASFNTFTGGVVKFSANPDRVGKTFNFRYRFMITNGSQLLVTKGGTKVVDGVKTVDWKQVLRRVKEFKK